MNAVETCEILTTAVCLKFDIHPNALWCFVPTFSSTSPPPNPVKKKLPMIILLKPWVWAQGGRKEEILPISQLKFAADLEHTLHQ